jgi:hypothetical protein
MLASAVFVSLVSSLVLVHVVFTPAYALSCSRLAAVSCMMASIAAAVVLLSATNMLLPAPVSYVLVSSAMSNSRLLYCCCIVLHGVISAVADLARICC